LGRHEEAEQILQRMFAVDPLSSLSLTRQFHRLVANGRYAQAHAVADKMSLHGKAQTYWYRANLSLFHQGNIAEGLYWGLKMGEELGDNYSRAWIALLFVHEYDEARRLTNEAEPYIAVQEGRWDDALDLSASLSELALVNPVVAVDLAGTYYNARRFEEALPLFERYFASAEDGGLPDSPHNGQLIEDVPVIRLMHLADTRRRLGDETGAREAAELARQENAKLRMAGRSDHNRDIAEAMLAAFDGDRVAAFAALRAAIRNGIRLPFHDVAIFDELRDDPEMVRISEELNAVMQQEHTEVLQLICFENPTPNSWRPLPETCEGVVDRPELLEFRQ
jgi:tetratricopeptide (TPR) repeat protein